MHPIPAAGLLIGVLCGVWTFVMGFTGWYRDPALATMFFMVIAIEIGGLTWGLRRTAAQGRGYWSQIVAGAMMSIVAGVIIIGSSLLFTTVAFPDYFREVEQIRRTMLEQQGKNPAEIEAAIQEFRSGATPMGYAMQGFIGTLITGILASALIAIRLRARPSQARTGAERC
jgi:hypothetical protein